MEEQPKNLYKPIIVILCIINAIQLIAVALKIS